MKSLLFVPGDRPERMRKALASGAHALILDLEDAVAIAAKPGARAEVTAFLAEPRAGAVKIFVRVNPLASGLIDDDLAAVLPARPDGLVIPKAEGAETMRAVAAKAGPDIPLLPIATETPAAIFALGSYRDVAAQLAGISWGAEDLPAAIGAQTSRNPDGSYTPPYELVRSLTLFAGHAAGVPVIDTVYPNFKDLDGLAAYAARAARDGFTGMQAIHPTQVPVINAAFTPSAEIVDRARRLVAAFEANAGAGVFQFEGSMVDAPHLKQAVRILRAANAAG